MSKNNEVKYITLVLFTSASKYWINSFESRILAAKDRRYLRKCSTNLTNRNVYDRLLVMLTNSVSIDEFRSNLAELMGRVMYGRDKIVIKKYNREAAVLLSLDEYEKLVDPTKRFSKEEWIAKFALLDEIKQRIPAQDQEALQKDIDDAVITVRAERRKSV